MDGETYAVASTLKDEAKRILKKSDHYMNFMVIVLSMKAWKVAEEEMDSDECKDLADKMSCELNIESCLNKL